MDAVIISADSMSRELFYVAASRGREAITVVTSDQELLRHSIARSGQRQSVSELERRSQNHGHTGHRTGEPRGLAGSRRTPPPAPAEDTTQLLSQGPRIEASWQQQSENKKDQSYGYQS